MGPELLLIRSFRLGFLLFSSGLVYPSMAQELNSFSNGEVADAEKINSNFQVLDQRLDGVEEALAAPIFNDNSLLDWGALGFETVNIDCDSDPTDFEKKWRLIGEKRGRVTVNVSGTCVLTEESYFFIFSQHVILDGGSVDRASCRSQATIRLPESVGSELSIDASNNASLFLFCLNFEAKNSVTLWGFGNAYLRTFAGVETANNNLRIDLRAGSTFRSNSLLPYIAKLSLLSGSVVELAPQTSIAIGEVIARGNSSISVLNGDGGLDLFQAYLEGGSSIDFTSTTYADIEKVIARQKSFISYSGSGDFSVEECTLTSGAEIFNNDQRVEVCPN